MAFVRFMSKPIGRIIKVGLGLGLVAVVFPMFGGTTGMATGLVLGIIGVHHVVALLGLALIALGTFNFCVVGPFVGGYFDGRKNLQATSPTTGRAHRGVPQH